ncbi:MAG: LCP family protein [Oscillospiraceae bacterium]|nr:LCP family protein [Oscillospiraceae bacterium]
MEREEFENQPEQGQKKKKSGCLIFLIVVLALVLVLLIAAAVGMNYIFGRLGRFENPTPEGETVQMIPDETETDPQENVEGLESVDASDVVFETVDVLEGEMINIMLIGQDRRPGEDRARSDSMILVTLNKEKNTIQLTSFMRDLYVQIPGYMDTRLNAAYRYGGTDLMNETFKVNFGLEIDGNVMVDFDEFTEIIEIIGGINIYMDGNEAHYMNKWVDGNFQKGMNYLDADQALAFVRMRYLSGGDYGRTDRQRRVIMAIAESLRDADLVTIFNLIDEVLPHIVTNLTDAQIIEYATTGLGILGSGGQMQTFRIPQDDAHYNANIRGMAVLVPNLEMCREDLKEFIYDNEG